jgi:hypothetical protein
MEGLHFLGEQLPLVEQPFPGEERDALRFSQSTYWLRAFRAPAARKAGGRAR